VIIEATNTATLAHISEHVADSLCPLDQVGVEDGIGRIPLLVPDHGCLQRLGGGRLVSRWSVPLLRARLRVQGVEGFEISHDQGIAIYMVERLTYDAAASALRLALCERASVLFRVQRLAVEYELCEDVVAVRETTVLLGCIEVGRRLRVPPAAQ